MACGASISTRPTPPSPAWSPTAHQAVNGGRAPVRHGAAGIVRPREPAGRLHPIVESQTEEDETRRTSWPYYLAYVQTKYKLPVVLLVVCGKAATARWVCEPITTGLPRLICQTTTSIVLGPDNVPAVTTVEEAASDLHFAVFLALTHSRGPAVRAILEALAAALETTDKATASDLSEFTEAGQGTTPGFEIWRALMASGTSPTSPKPAPGDAPKAKS